MKTYKRLDNLIKLSSNVKIYVPSTVNVNEDTDNTEYIDKTLTFLSGLFGGSTMFQAFGCWKASNGELVKEHIDICESYCDQSALEMHIASIVEYCETLKAEMSQEAISLEINNELYFI